MIVVRITGGLGNQMFQFAFARSLQTRGKRVALQWHGHRTKSRHNGFELDRAFMRPLSEVIPVVNCSPALNTLAWAMRKVRRTREPSDMRFTARFLDLAGGYLDGYWQTEKYFATVADTIRRDFAFKAFSGGKNAELLRHIETRPCVSVHVRRGDYVGHAGLGGVCSPDYYNRALAALDARLPGCAVVVFSDDAAYCREMFADRSGVVFCDWNCGENSWMDMALMSRCAHHIIANSSFSWWGAWLSAAGGVVIGPQRWFSESAAVCNPDICPERWFLI